MNAELMISEMQIEQWKQNASSQVAQIDLELFMSFYNTVMNSEFLKIP